MKIKVENTGRNTHNSFLRLMDLRQCIDLKNYLYIPLKKLKKKIKGTIFCENNFIQELYFMIFGPSFSRLKSIRFVSLEALFSF